ncbi:MAG: hypothetical protein WC356_00315 [Candidatus Micrarchaeia archaeon]|jgi:dolichol kinase
MNEDERQAIHILIGFVFLALLILSGRINTLYILSAGLILGLVLIHLFISGIRVPVASWFFDKFERKNVLPGYGSLWYVVGCIFILSISQNVNLICAVFFILALGDGFATIIGSRGKMKLFYNKKKTFEGTLAFAVSSLPALFFLPSIVCFVAIIVSAFAESLDLGIDDNFIIPFVCCLVFFIL